MRNGVVVVGLLALLLLAPAFSVQGSSPSPDPLSVAPFVEGDFAQYEARFRDFPPLVSNYTVRGPSQTISVVGAPVDVFVLHREWGEKDRSHEQRISLSTFAVENQRYSCSIAAVNSDGSETCYPFSTWMFDQGVPGLFGATLLQGRSFRVGDAWEQQGTCLGCRFPASVSIEAPRSDSPEGTDFVARVAAESTFGGILGTGRLHMSTDTPFPLLADLRLPWGNYTARLLSATPGEGVVFANAAPAAPHYEAPLAQVPFEGRRPVEGAPLAGWPSWAEARDATAPDAADRDETAVFMGIDYFNGEGWSKWTIENPLYPTVPVVHRIMDSGERRFYFDTTFAFPGNRTVNAEYTRTTSSSVILDRPNPLQPETTVEWEVEETEGPGDHVPDCPAESVPLWDLVRHSESTGLLGPFNGFWVDRSGFFGPPCTREDFHVKGDTYPPNAGFGFLEGLTMDFHTGFLRLGLILDGPEASGEASTLPALAPHQVLGLRAS